MGEICAELNPLAAPFSPKVNENAFVSPITVTNQMASCYEWNMGIKRTGLNPLALPFIPREIEDDIASSSLSSENLSFSDFTYVDPNNAVNNLREIRIKNVNRLIIGSLNINSLSSKFDQLHVIIGDYLDILIIQETKLDSSFPEGQFMINGYTKPYRLDRDHYGGGVMIYIREDIPSKELKKHNFTKNIEGLFIEVNLRKTKFILFGTYHSPNPIYGIGNDDYFEQVSLALDMYSSYEKFLLAGNFNVDRNDSSLMFCL